jgi:hypothetical protein
MIILKRFPSSNHEPPVKHEPLWCFVVVRADFFDFYRHFGDF